MNGVSRRVFLTTTGVAAGGVLAASDCGARASRAPALTLSCANYVRFLPIATGDVRPAISR